MGASNSKKMDVAVAPETAEKTSARAPTFSVQKEKDRLKIILLGPSDSGKLWI